MYNFILPQFGELLKLSWNINTLLKFKEFNSIIWVVKLIKINNNKSASRCFSYQGFHEGLEDGSSTGMLGSSRPKNMTDSHIYLCIALSASSENPQRGYLDHNTWISTGKTLFSKNKSGNKKVLVKNLAFLFLLRAHQPQCGLIHQSQRDRVISYNREFPQLNVQMLKQGALNCL